MSLAALLAMDIYNFGELVCLSLRVVLLLSHTPNYILHRHLVIANWNLLNTVLVCVIARTPEPALAASRIRVGARAARRVQRWRPAYV